MMTPADIYCLAWHLYEQREYKASRLAFDLADSLTTIEAYEQEREWTVAERKPTLPTVRPEAP